MIPEDHKSDLRQACDDITDFTTRMKFCVDGGHTDDIKYIAHWNRHIRAKLDVIEELCKSSAKR
jgi:hypothetical protein